MPKFSIITCTLNSEKFIKDNIESVEKQTFQDYEHIFIDGFSTDNTIQILEEYQKRSPQRVKIYQLPPKGIANAFNEGIKRSQGEYIIHLNSDDYFYDANVLEKVNNFLNNNEYDWVYGKVNVILEGKPIGIWPKRKIWHRKSNFLGKFLLKFYNFVPHQAVFIKREIFEKYGYFDENLPYGPDIEYWLRIMKRTKWVFIDIIVSNYRVHKSANSIVNKLQMQKIINEVKKKYLNEGEFLIYKLFNFFSNFYKKY